jgi:hypothetical protein
MTLDKRRDRPATVLVDDHDPNPATMISNDFTDNNIRTPAASAPTEMLRGLSDCSFGPQSLRQLRTGANRWERVGRECTQCFKRN